METNQITIYIRYHRLDFYGKSSQVPLNVPNNITLGELKERTAIKLQIDPEYQSMTLKVINRIVPLENNDATLLELGVKNLSKIFLEQINLNDHEHEGSSDEEVNLNLSGKDILSSSPDNSSVHEASVKLSGLKNPKYFLKLGIMK